MESALNQNLDLHRRRAGLILGASLGAAYGLSSQWVNLIALPGVPLYQPPFGPFGNTLLFTLIGAGLGLLSSWPESSLAGIFLASAVGGLGIAGLTFAAADPSMQWAARIVSMLFLFLPLAAACIPAVGLLRWVVNGQMEVLTRRSASRTQRFVPLFLVIGFIVLGLFSLQPAPARTMLARMHGLIQVGLSASDVSSLPPSFQPDKVKHFLEGARGAYTLEWDRDVNNAYHFPRPLAAPEKQALVVARFETNWNLVCLFVNPDAEPDCRDFYGTEIPLAW